MSKYNQIYLDLLTKIENDTFAAGSLMPSENELMQEYQASRDTIRKALNLLVYNGYIQKSKGRKSIVLDNNRFKFPVSGVLSFKELKPSLGNDVQTEVLTFEIIPCDESTKKKLKLQTGDLVYYIERIRKVDGERIILDIDIINAKMIPGLTKEIAQDSIYEYIEKTLNLNISFAKKEITVVDAHGLDYRCLDLKNYDMVACVKSYSYLDNAEIFQYTESRHRPDKFRFTDFARRNN